MIAGQPSEVEVSPDGLQVWSQFSHLGYNDFGRTGDDGGWIGVYIIEKRKNKREDEKVGMVGSVHGGEGEVPRLCVLV